MFKPQSNEPLSKFETLFSAQQSENFFRAVSWQLASRPGSPPTIATIFRRGEFEALQSLGITLEKVLHAEQKYKFYSELAADVEYRGETFINSLHEKSSVRGRMSFYVFQTNLLDPSGHLCIECLSTVVVRN